VTKRQLEIIQHAVGADEFGKRKQSDNRNFFCAGPEDEPDCQALIELGYMQRHRTTELFPYFNCSVTGDGINAMLRESPPPPKKTRSQLRMEEYRSFSDAYDCTFREFLNIIKTDWYKGLRA
jgi:hypothetical protein